MITTTEDQFDVDYDVFSFAGRAALIGGGLYALDQSLKQGHFKDLKGNKHALKRHNPIIKDYKEALSQDLVSRPDKIKADYSFRETTQFNPTQEMIKKRKANTRVVAGMDSEIIMKDGSKKLVKNLFEGGFNGRSADLPDVLKSLQEKIKGHDNRGSAPFTLTFDDNEKIQAISIRSNEGVFEFDVVGKDGTINKRNNRIATRGAIGVDPGQTPGRVYGADVAAASYVERLYGEQKITPRMVRQKFSHFTRHLDKNFGDLEVDKINPMTLKATVMSGMIDPYLDKNSETIAKVMEKALDKGAVIGSAEDINKGILFLEGDPYANDPFLRETENPKQKHRSNTKYRRIDGTETYNENVKVLYANEDFMTLLRKNMADAGIQLGELGKEERIVNNSLMGTIVDNSRSLTISNRRMSKAGDYYISRLAVAAGMSEAEFSTKLAEGKGFAAFNTDQVKAMQEIGIDDYTSYLRKELDQSFVKRKAYMAANKGITNWGRGFYEQAAFQEAMALKKEGKLAGALAEIDTTIKDVFSDYKNRRIFGDSIDGRERIKLEGKHSGLKFNNIKVTDNGLTFGFKRESQIKIGSKIHDPSGQEKATAKLVVDGLGGFIVKTMEQLKGSALTDEEIKKYSNIHFIGTDKGLKVDPELRNLNSVFLSIEQNALETGDTKTQKMMSDYRANAANMTDEDKMNFWRSLRDSGKSFGELQGNNVIGGYLRTSQVAFGADNIDMGFGGHGFFSERHIRLFASMGVGEYAKEIVGRRVNKGAVKTYEDFRQVQQLMKDSAKAGFIDMERLNRGDFFENVFNSDIDENASAFEMRQKYLSKFKAENGVTFFELGEDIDGLRRIPIFMDDRYKGYAGEQIGSTGDKRSFTEIENLTRDIAREARKPDRDREKLRTMIKDYKAAISLMDGNLNIAKTKGKFTNSGYLVLKSGSEDLKSYATKIAEINKTQQAFTAVARVDNRRFIDMFGQDAFEQFKKTGISDAWGMVLREPADAAAALPMNFIPGGAANDTIEMMEEVLPMIGGDLDQDAISAGAALTDKGKAQIKELAFGNGKNAVLFRKSMNEKTQLSLKGRGSKSIFDHSFEEHRRASFLGKLLEKGLVGHVSNSLAVVQQLNQRLNALDNPEKFHRTTQLVGLLVENTIKGKKQSMQELLDRKSYKMLDAIVGQGDFDGKDIKERMAMVRSFLDEIILNKGSKFADRIRKGEKSEEFIQEIAQDLAGGTANQSHYDDARRMVNNTILNELTSDENLGLIFEYSDMAGQYKDIGEDVDSLIDEVYSNKTKAEIETITRLEEAQDAVKNVKKSMNKFGGNLAAYSLLPAAALGIMGTVFGARSSISSDVEFSDNQKRHDKSNGKPFKPMESINMKHPTHMKPEIAGKASSGFQINRYAATHKTSDMRIQDDTRNFDYYDMQDKMRRGY